MVKPRKITLYKLSQKVDVGVNQSEWVDINTELNEQRLREQAADILVHNPNAILGLRSVTEEELPL